MKNILILLTLFIAIGLNVNAQDKTIKSPATGYVWGTAATDTLGASDTLDYTIRTTSNKHSLNVNLGLLVTKVSGTVTNNFFIQASMDGTNFENLDTIALSNASTSMQTTIKLVNYNYPYLRFRGVSGATAQKAWYKMYYYIKEN